MSLFSTLWIVCSASALWIEYSACNIYPCCWTHVTKVPTRYMKLSRNKPRTMGTGRRTDVVTVNMQ